MGEAFDIAAVTAAWERMLVAPRRPTVAAWAAQHEPALRDLAAEAWRLEVNTDDRKGLLRGEAARLVDGLLCRVARGRGALALAMGEGLTALSQGGRLLRLGYVCLADYAREELGMAGRTAQAMVQLSGQLRMRPLLRDAVLRGEVSPRKALALLPVAVGADEAAWVERGRSETVRALEQSVKGLREEEGGGEAGEEAWEKVRLSLSAEQREPVERALKVAEKVVNVPAARQQCLEAMAQEYLGEHGGEAGEQGDAAGGGGPYRAVAALGAEERSGGPGGWAGVVNAEEAEGGSFGEEAESWLEAVKRELEVETARWEALVRVEPVAAPLAGEETSPRAIGGELRRLAGMLARWDELVGHLGLVMKFFGLSREVGFASFEHYCVERLGMAPRTVGQRVSLERRFYDLPGLREAMRSGRIGYEQARLVADVAEVGTVEEWVRRAEETSCIALRRTIDKEEEVQMRAQGEMSFRVPRRVAEVMEAAFRAARRRAGRELTAGECLAEIARHFLGVWEAAVKERSTPQRKARRRDEYCQVPGCSRRPMEAHHLLHVSQGGPDDPWNLTGVCAGHHLCIHRGWVRVRGRAPDQLVWELGERPGDGEPSGTDLC